MYGAGEIVSSQNKLFVWALNKAENKLKLAEFIWGKYSYDQG